MCRTCSGMQQLCDSAPGGERRTDVLASYLLWKYCPTEANFNLSLRNLTKHSFLCSFLHCFSLDSHILKNLSCGLSLFDNNLSIFRIRLFSCFMGFSNCYHKLRKEMLEISHPKLISTSKSPSQSGNNNELHTVSIFRWLFQVCF